MNPALKYLKSRGIDNEKVIKDADIFYTPNGFRNTDERCHALGAIAIQSDGRRMAIEQTLLNEDGSIVYGKKGAKRKTLGSASDGFVSIKYRFEKEMIYLCEGVVTGLSIAIATEEQKCCIYATLTDEGFKKFTRRTNQSHQLTPKFNSGADHSICLCLDNDGRPKEDVARDHLVQRAVAHLLGNNLNCDIYMNYPEQSIKGLGRYGCDYNDILVHKGLDALKEQLHPDNNLLLAKALDIEPVVPVSYSQPSESFLIS